MESSYEAISYHVKRHLFTAVSSIHHTGLYNESHRFAEQRDPINNNISNSSGENHIIGLKHLTASAFGVLLYKTKLHSKFSVHVLSVFLPFWNIEWTSAMTPGLSIYLHLFYHSFPFHLNKRNSKRERERNDFLYTFEPLPKIKIKSFIARNHFQLQFRVYEGSVVRNKLQSIS